jgi:O-antigen chain-terminating methyltransferase
MTNSHRIGVNIAEIKKEIQQDAEQLKARSPLAMVPVKRAIDDVNYDTGAIAELLRNAESRAYDRVSWPSTLDRFPFTLLKPLKKLVLKVLNLIFKDQREVNYNLIRALQESVAINQELLKQLKTVQNLTVDYASMASGRVEQYHRDYTKEHTTIKNHVTQISTQTDRAFTQFQELTSKLQYLEPELQETKQELQETKQLKSETQKLEQNIQSIQEIIDALQEKASINQELPPSLVIPQQSYLSEAIALSQLPFPEIQHNKSKSLFYYLFENVFYNSVAVKEKQKIYLQYINRDVNQQHVFLDAGCGRGEFLHNLIAEGFQATGIDINEVEINLLKSQGLDVSCSDILDHLKDSDQVYSGISSFQVIEHLSYEYIDDFLNSAYESLASGGVIILETINPHCPYGFSSFYQDPTHVKLIPPEMLSFLLEWHGFRQLQVLYSTLMPQPLRIFMEARMNYHDYALIGYKP